MAFYSAKALMGTGFAGILSEKVYLFFFIPLIFQAVHSP
jgi:hypothetical protein